MARLLNGLVLATVLAVLLSVALSAGRAQEKTAGFLDAVVKIEAVVTSDARTAATLGTRRSGSGVVIGDDGLIVTIGYLILEAESAEVVAREQRVSATIIGYDHETGLGLLRAATPLDIAPLEVGDSSALRVRDLVLVASHGGLDRAQRAYIVSRREFAGYWEYLVDDAIFTTPPYPEFGGAALIGGDGRLVGIGSLAVGDAVPGETSVPGNMFVPIDLLKPILGDMLAHGRRAGRARPWIGMFTEEFRGHVFVTRVAPDGPAEKAGVKPGDIVLAVAGEGVESLADLFRKVWARGDAGVEVPLAIVQGSTVREMLIHTADRYDYLRLGARR
ncbi:MAG: S1C family serine protease [Alphaproteobacteria bacterium]